MPVAQHRLGQESDHALGGDEVLNVLLRAEHLASLIQLLDAPQPPLKRIFVALSEARLEATADRVEELGARVGAVAEAVGLPIGYPLKELLFIAALVFPTGYDNLLRVETLH